MKTIIIIIVFKGKYYPTHGFDWIGPWQTMAVLLLHSHPGRAHKYNGVVELGFQLLWGMVAVDKKNIHPATI